MDAITKKQRLHTSHATMAQLAVWLVANKEQLESNTLAQIVARARAQFNGQVINDGSVRAACEAAGIVPKVPSKGKKQFDRSAIVAKSLLAIVGRIEVAIGAEPGSLIEASDREVLVKIAKRDSLK